jgi:hypothetical protein
MTCAVRGRIAFALDGQAQHARSGRRALHRGPVRDRGSGRGGGVPELPEVAIGCGELAVDRAALVAVYGEGVGQRAVGEPGDVSNC